MHGGAGGSGGWRWGGGPGAPAWADRRSSMLRPRAVAFWWGGAGRRAVRRLRSLRAGCRGWRGWGQGSGRQRWPGCREAGIAAAAPPTPARSARHMVAAGGSRAGRAGAPAPTRDVVKVDVVVVLAALLLVQRVGVVHADVLGQLAVRLEAARLVRHVPAQAEGWGAGGGRRAQVGSRRAPAAPAAGCRQRSARPGPPGLQPAQRSAVRALEDDVRLLVLHRRPGHPPRNTQPPLPPHTAPVLT